MNLDLRRSPVFQRVTALALFGLMLSCSGTGNDAIDPADGANPSAARNARERSARVEGIGPNGKPYSEDRAACLDRSPNKRAFWGELHVHSSLSMDAYIWGVRNGPDETYRFARGEQTVFPLRRN